MCASSLVSSCPLQPISMGLTSLRMALSLDVDLVWVSLSKCYHPICENSRIHPPARPPGLPISEAFLLHREEVAEVRRNRREALIQLSVGVPVPMAAITRITATAIARLDAAPSLDPKEQGVNSLQARTSVLLMSCKMVDEEDPFLIAR